jgi:pimeloyl-ACP methyl ester carboxylesterase
MIHSMEAGNSNNPAIVFLHGSPLSSRMWRMQMEELQSEYYCLAPDLPGHGKSAAEPFESAKTVAEKIAAIIAEKVPSKRAHVVGLSFGGVIAQAMLTHTPAVLNKVILSGTSARLSPIMMKIQDLNKPFFKFLKPEQLAALVSMQFAIPRQFQEEFKQDFREFSVPAFSQMMDSYGMIEPLAGVTVPFLAVAGGRETFVAKDMVRTLIKDALHSTGGIVKDAGHVWNLQFPRLFSEMVRAYFNERPLPIEISVVK